MEHITDSDFADPFILPGTESSSTYSFQADSEALATIVSMGFTPEQATKALKATDNNVERAMDWIFSHMDDLNSDNQDGAGGATAATSNPQFRDGDGSKLTFQDRDNLLYSITWSFYIIHFLSKCYFG